MSQHYLFHQAGVIPGIPGIFGNCRVDIADDGTITQSPLYAQTPIETSAQEEPVQPAPETPVEHLQALEQEVQQVIEEVQQEQPPAEQAQPEEQSAPAQPEA